MTELRTIAIPSHKASFTLIHNDHLSYYETVEENQRGKDILRYWVSEEEYKKAVETNEMWEVHWYPNTPVGFHTLRASTLEALNLGIVNFYD